jgi:hypothetical protein
MLIDSRLHVSEGSLPFTKTWTVPTGYTISTVAVTVDGGTLGTGARAPSTVGNVTTFYLTAASPTVVQVIYTVTLTPYAVVVVSDMISFV